MNTVLKEKYQFDSMDYYKHLWNENIDGNFQAIQLVDGAVKNRYNKKDHNVIELINEVEGEENWFININTMYRNYRAVSDIRQLRALYIDLDLLGTGYTKIQAIYELYELAIDKKIPMYSMIVDSGRGLHIYWRIEDAPFQALGTWQELEHYLYYNLKHLGADLKATDGARVLRLPKTINPKCNELTKVLFVNEELKYSMRDLREEYLNYKPKKYKKATKSSTKEVRKKVVSNAFFNSYSLHMERAEDLYSLCYARNFKVTGHRNMIIHCYAYWKGLVVKNEEELEEIVNKLNDKFTEPLKHTEIKAVLRAVGKQVEKFIEYENKFRAGTIKKKIAGKNDKAGYWYKNQTLIERLDITVKEQESLKTIISKEEKYRRKNIKRTPRNEIGLTKKQIELQEQEHKVKELRLIGVSMKKIGEELGMSKAKVVKLANL